jgi:large subunit ribosomal protein L15
MNLGELHPAPNSKKRRKRVGRGPASGHGKTSTRGHKGHKARSGGGKGPGFEGGQMPLYRRIPKRGFKSRSRREFAVLNLADLARKFPQGGEVSPATMASAGLLRPRRDVAIKVLGEGDLPAGQAFVVRAHAFSKSATQKIEAGGGRVEVITA